MYEQFQKKQTTLVIFPNKRLGGGLINSETSGGALIRGEVLRKI